MSHPITDAASGPTTTDAVRAGVITLVVAAVANLLVLVAGRAAGADMSVAPGGTTDRQEIGYASVLITTVLPLVIGSVALAIATRWGSRGWMTLAWLGLVLGIVTVAMPLGATASTATTFTLVTMHLVVGVVWFVAVLRSLANRRTST